MGDAERRRRQERVRARAGRPGSRFADERAPGTAPSAPPTLRHFPHLTRRQGAEGAGDHQLLLVLLVYTRPKKAKGKEEPPKAAPVEQPPKDAPKDYWVEFELELLKRIK
jgi:hypothetical protein